MNKAISILPLLLCISVVACAQHNNNFSLYIKYEVSAGDPKSYYADMLPEHFDFYYKNEQTLVKTVSHLPVSDVLYKQDFDLTYLINNRNREIMEHPVVTKAIYTTEDTGRKEKILDYECRILKVTSNQGGQELIQFIWVTEDLPMIIPLASLSSKSLFPKIELGGIPLKMHSESTIDDQAIIMIISAKKVDMKTLPDSLFDIPTHYHRVHADDTEFTY
ncbi:MAG: DUF4412 domain-containing protein [Cyclobacteriaceae bacterium]